MYTLKYTPSTSSCLLLPSYSTTTITSQYNPGPAARRPINSLLSSSSPLSTHASSPSLPLSNNTCTSPNSYPLTPIDFIERAAVVYGDCPSIVYNDTSRTWFETRARCLKLASSIASLGISKGDVVSVLAPNVPAMCELHFAVPMAGAILNNLNLRLDAKQISNQLQHSESRLLFVDSQSASVATEAVSMFPPTSDRPILVLIRENDSSTRFENYNLDYERMVESGDERFDWIRPDSEWDPIALNYTSGTSSAPKGVLQSHRGAFVESLNLLLDWPVPAQPVYLWTLPMFHANGWSYAWNLAAVGGLNVCLRRVDAPSIYDSIERHGVTHMCGAPVVLNMLTNHHRSEPLRSRRVHVMTAGAPPPAAVLGRAESLGFVVSHGYGLTETGGPVVTCAWKREWDGLGGPERAKMKARQGVKTIGFAGFDVVDPETGAGVPRDGRTMGEIVLRGGSMMLGYLKDPEGTARCTRGGWFYTGDVGVVHPDGYLEVKDRSKDVIITGGENLSSVEVEAVLYGHPAVNEAAVVARPCVFWGETPCAFVSLKAGDEKPTTTEKDIREYCKERLPLYMVPRRVVFKDDLPKTSTESRIHYILN